MSNELKHDHEQDSKEDISKKVKIDNEENDPFFKSIGDQAQGIDQSAASADAPYQEVESLCMRCYKDGTTRLMLTDIPFFKQVILQSFRCPHCDYHNNTIQSAGAIQDLGVRYSVDVRNRKDLDRRVVKSETGLVSIPELELQIPGSKAQLTTIEGILADTIADLSADQDTRRESDPASYEAIQKFISRLENIVSFTAGQEPEKPVAERFTFIVQDPTGNSFIESYDAFNDPKWKKTEFERSQAQNEVLGLVPEGSGSAAEPAEAPQTLEEVVIGPDEVFTFQAPCSCGSTAITNMKSMNIPHFKDIILLSSFCDDCGYRDNEVKSGGAISPDGRKITLSVTERDDLSRDILKSETAGLYIPEIDLELQPGTLGGRFTTLEGLLTQVYEELDQRAFARGDTRLGEENNITRFLNKLRGAIEVEFPYTVILDDALANSYIQSLYAPDPDPSLKEESYPRTHEQNEELGLNDIKTD